MPQPFGTPYQYTQFWPTADGGHITEHTRAVILPNENVRPTTGPIYEPRDGVSKKRKHQAVPDPTLYKQPAQEGMHAYPTTTPHHPYPGIAPGAAWTPMLYDPSTASHAPLNRESARPVPISSHTSGTPSLPGATMYEQLHLERSASATRNKTQSTGVPQARESAARKHSSSPPRHRRTQR
jgi:hypothetical protein